ncbi:hypothetical protein CDIK_1566 [Cucumispora dikerogammari]|nr:hypothetical protein CDIK_1566 [Cucumispora dikerogammari]
MEASTNSSESSPTQQIKAIQPSKSAVQKKNEVTKKLTSGSKKRAIKQNTKQKTTVVLPVKNTPVSGSGEEITAKVDLKKQDLLLKHTIHNHFSVSENNNFYCFFTPQKKEISVYFFEHFLFTKECKYEIFKIKFVSNELLLIIYKTHMEIMNIFNKKIEIIANEPALINAYYIKAEKLLILEKESVMFHIINEKKSEFPKEHLKIIDNLIYLIYRNTLTEFDFLMNELRRFSCPRLSDFWLFEDFLFSLSGTQLILANIEPLLDVRANRLFVNRRFIFLYFLHKNKAEDFKLKIYAKTEMAPKFLKSVLCSSFRILGETNLVYLTGNELYVTDLLKCVS